MNEEDRNIIMADMEGLWQGNQPSETTRDQEMVNIYVTMILQLILMDPWISTSQILAELAELSWTGSEARILSCLGGWRIFVQTIERMETLRTGVLNERVMNFPITTTPPVEGAFGARIPEPDGFIAWWAPQLEGEGPPFMFRIVRAEEGVINRYPHCGSYTVDYSEEDLTDIERHSSSS